MILNCDLNSIDVMHFLVINQLVNNYTKVIDATFSPGFVYSKYLYTNYGKQSQVILR